jgi:hypothetical protein
MQSYRCPTPIIAWVPCTCYRDGLTTEPPKWMHKYLREGYWWMPRGSDKQHDRKTAQYLEWSKTACAHPYMLLKVDYLDKPYTSGIHDTTTKYLFQIGHNFPKIELNNKYWRGSSRLDEQRLSHYLSETASILGYANRLTLVELQNSYEMHVVVNRKLTKEVKRVRQHGTGLTLVAMLHKRGLCLYPADDLDLQKPPLWTANSAFIQHQYEQKKGTVWALVSEPAGNTILLDEPFAPPTTWIRTPFHRVDFWVREVPLHLESMYLELKRILPILQLARTHWGTLPYQPLQPEVLFHHLTKVHQKLMGQLKDGKAFLEDLRAFHNETGLICQFEPPETDQYWTMRFITTKAIEGTAADLFALQERVQKMLSLQGIPHVHKALSGQFN